MAFKKAVKKKSKLRVLFIGPSGSGKTWTALQLASLLAKHFKTKIAGIDSERGSMSKYADNFEFDVDELEKFSPEEYVAKFKEAERQGYGVLVPDSLSHEWAGTGGILEKVDNAAAGGNKWAGWRVGTPAHTAFIDALLQSKTHVIATARAKTEWVLEDVNGKKVPKAVGMGAVQRDGVEFEFDVVVHLSADHVGTVVKTRAPALDKATLRDPAPELAHALIGWLEGGVEDVVAVPDTTTAPAPAAAAAASANPPAEPAQQPQPGAAASPALPAETPAAGFARVMREAASVTALDGVAAAIGPAVKAGKVSGAERKELVALYNELHEKLSAPPVVVVATTTAAAAAAQPGAAA